MLSTRILRCGMLNISKNDVWTDLSHRKIIHLRNVRWDLANSNGASFYCRSVHNYGDPDKFGTLSNVSLLKRRLEELPEEDGDKEVNEFIDGVEGKTRLRTLEYAKIIKLFLKEKKLADALDTLDERMKNEKAKPDDYIYRLLIAGCAKMGYTKKAFQLFNQMKKRALKVKPNIYTSLFDACANSPLHSDGLKRALGLWELIIEKRIEINYQLAHAAIKAFGRCNDIEMAFKIVDEMTSRQIPITTETMNFLLQACISEKSVGLRHALMVCRKMLGKKINPDIYTWNLLLRCVKECSIGDISKFKEDLDNLILYSEPSKKLLNSKSTEEYLPHSNEINSDDHEKQIVHSNVNEVTRKEATSYDSLLQLDKMDKPWNRLLLLGGLQNFINMMIKMGSKPDIKTFTHLLAIINPDVHEQQVLLDAIKQHGVKIDIDFCNLLIKKRNFHSDPEGAKGVLKIIQEEQLIPNIVTFGVLALGCSNLRDIKALMINMKKLDYKLNIEIVGALIRGACRLWDFKAIYYIVAQMKKYEIKPNLRIIKQLENLHQEVLKNFNNKEKGLRYYNRIDNIEFEEDFKNFVYILKYIKTLEAEDEKLHPWKQFDNKKKSALG